MTSNEAEIAIEWAANEGWNPGLNDAASFYTADPNGFFIGLHGGQPISMISAVQYGQSFGFIGFYIVKPEWRGQGYGIQTWNTGLAYLANRNIGLDGVLEQQSNYEKSGFQIAYKNIRYEGIIGGPADESPYLIDLSNLPFKQIESYDRDFFPEERSRFLHAWLEQPKCIAKGVTINGELVGYGMLRPCQVGYKVGPLFANTPDIAEQIFTSLMAQGHEGEPIYFDVPETNQQAVDLADKYQMNRVFETARMYTKQTPNLPIDRLFGVTSFELG